MEPERWCTGRCRTRARRQTGQAHEQLVERVDAQQVPFWHEQGPAIMAGPWKAWPTLRTMTMNRMSPNDTCPARMMQAQRDETTPCPGRQRSDGLAVVFCRR